MTIEYDFALCDSNEHSITRFMQGVCLETCWMSVYGATFISLSLSYTRSWTDMKNDLKTVFNTCHASIINDWTKHNGQKRDNIALTSNAFWVLQQMCNPNHSEFLDFAIHRFVCVFCQLWVNFRAMFGFLSIWFI